jgi:hypothetical protein
MHIINARLRHQEGLHELHLENGLISHIARQTEAPTWAPTIWMPVATWWYRPSSSRTFTSMQP